MEASPVVVRNIQRERERLRKSREARVKIGAQQTSTGGLVPDAVAAIEPSTIRERLETFVGAAGTR
ncbi:hypothetical protein BKD09_21210 [Bradyrhizobium japonicum]|uniref:Uncharacterized protein n=1 Tax=Bradyrhizobium japonicum TaxID=375 RepID=A0A1L3FC29_BRAJP|nr:hypothetical protein BKD09_21210 [Bradyrhizobium japonicum]